MVRDRINDTKNILSYEAIMRALFENYESIYDIDVETSAYQCYHESESYSELKIASSGEDFFASLNGSIQKVIHPDDREYVRRMLSRETMLAALKKGKYHTFVYRLLRDGLPCYHKIRATIDIVAGREHILLGVRDVDETLKHEKAHTEALASMHQKEKNHMEAILASAAEYLEVNLTQDLVLERSSSIPSPDFAAASGSDVQHSYSAMNRWLCEHMIVENVARYAHISAREHLLACFERDEKRASVSFSIKQGENDIQPCKEVFYIYRDNSTGDVMCFCVIYDLTEEQRQEKEMRELENALQMSRIHNSTSQMQPHFLYNALGSIQEIVLDDPEYASRLIGDFTTHLRSCIRAMANDAPFPFEQELENIKAYVNIEQMRFGKKLKVIYDVPVKDFSILPLSVQPLVENAIRHGIYNRGARGGTVSIRSREREDAWLVEVEDNGVGFDVDAVMAAAAAGTKDSTGIKNIIFRLDKMMRADVDIQSVPGVGTKVLISIPKGGAASESDSSR